MKSLFILTTLAASLLSGMAEAPMQTAHEVDMRLANDLIFQKMVKIYDYEGTLIREIPIEDVANDKISMLDYMILEDSDFAFDYQGDYYYFGNTKNIQAVVN